MSLRTDPAPDDPALTRALAASILGVDTLWGGDVMSASGTGRFIADSWFADEPLPLAYTCAEAAALRAGGGVAGKDIDAAAVDRYLRAVDVLAAIAEVRRQGDSVGGLRGRYLLGLAESLQVMWELALERLGRGPAVPYERCVLASTGKNPSPSAPDERRAIAAALLEDAGYRARSPEELLGAVDAWRRDRMVPARSIPMLADAFIAWLEAGTARHVVPRLPAGAARDPARQRPIPAHRRRLVLRLHELPGPGPDPAGEPRYEATYELNARLEISIPELAQLVAHEVVPGHVTTFALLQARHVRRELGFEATVLTMNTRAAALSEGIANNALLLALGCAEGVGPHRPRLAARPSRWPSCRTTARTRRRGSPGARAPRGSGWRRPSGASTCARPSVPTSSPAPGVGTRCSAACTCPPTAPARRRSRSSSSATSPRGSSRPCTAPAGWWTS